MSEYDGRIQCGKCVFFELVSPGLGLCRRYPPQLAFLPVARPTITGGRPGVDWVSQGVAPSVQEKGQACGEFRPKSEIVN
jgi:hypothetical protein